MTVFKQIEIEDTDELAEIYVESFNAYPWNDRWTVETASKRLHQMINCESFYGIKAYIDLNLCGMILGNEEQFYNGVVFNIKEFCIKNSLRGNGIGTEIFKEFEKRLKLRNIDEIILCTLKNENTEGFYNKMGLKSNSQMTVMGKKLH